jgi:serine/threonine protein kinase
MASYVRMRAGTDSGREIGSGGSGRVTLERDPTSQKLIAVKHIVLRDGITDLVREVEALAQLNHPCVLRLLGFSLPHGSTSSQIHFEYARNGSLDRVLVETRHGYARSFWNGTGIGIIICGIVLGMRYVHWCRVVHRDLKPGNIFLDENGHALIGDFGSSRIDYDDGTPTGGCECGSVHYAAPELFEEGASGTEASDVFSFGLILYEVLVGSAVFCSSLPPLEVVRRRRVGWMPRIPATCGGVLSDLIARCWSPAPQTRPSFQDILSLFQRHSFRVFPNADALQIDKYYQGILEWERSEGLSISR